MQYILYHWSESRRKNLSNLSFRQLSRFVTRSLLLVTRSHLDQLLVIRCLQQQRIQLYKKVAANDSIYRQYAKEGIPVLTRASILSNSRCNSNFDITSDFRE